MNAAPRHPTCDTPDRPNLTRRALQGWAVSAALLGAILNATPALAQRKPPEEGLDYVNLNTAAPTEKVSGKIEVVEFFWYHCPHCNRFEPTLNAWLKKLPKDVHFRRVPVAFRPNFVPDQQLYYALEAMGKLDQLHHKVFAAIHDERLNLDSREQIIDWVSKQGLDKTKFTSYFDSPSILAKTNQATKLQMAYNVSGVPALGIAGKFYTDGGLAQSMERALQITDYLIANERKK